MAPHPFSPLLNYFKPHKQEALARVRVNGLGLVAVALSSYLVPGLPPLLNAMNSVLGSSKRRRHDYGFGDEEGTSMVWEWVCIVEVALSFIFSFNVLEALYAIRYPKPAATTPFTPANKPLPKSPFLTPVASKSKSLSSSLRTLSPNSSPQPQKPFSHSPSPVPMITPAATPSKIMHYSAPPGSIGIGASSSLSSTIASTPSPTYNNASFRGRRSGGIGRPLDGSYLAQIETGEDD